MRNIKIKQMNRPKTYVINNSYNYLMDGAKLHVSLIVMKGGIWKSG